MLCALIVGTALALTTWYTVQLHGQVDRLQAKVCTYQETAIDLARALAEAGHPLPPGTLPGPEHCP